MKLMIKDKTRKAFSLIEILISVALLAVLVISHLTLTYSEAVSARDVADRIRATALARNVLAVMEAERRERLVRNEKGAAPVTVDPLADSEVKKLLGVPLESWATNRKAVTEVVWQAAPDGNASEHIALLSCTVIWEAARGHQRSLRLRKVVAR
mgnify:CR=1 FL=1